MKHERARHHDKRGARYIFAATRTALAARFEQRQNLNGFAQAHVVGQAAAEAEALEEKQPGQAVALVTAQLAGEVRRWLGGLDTGKIDEFPAYPREYRIDGDGGLAGKQSVQQPGLRPREAQMFFLESAESGKQSVFFHPLFGNDAESAVVELDHRLALFDRAQQLRQRNFGVAEHRAAVELEPIDAGFDLHRQLLRGAIELALRLDMPTFVGQRAHHFRQLRGVQLRVGIAAVIDRAKTELDYSPARVGFEAGITPNQPALLFLIVFAAARAESDFLACVIEGKFAPQPGVAKWMARSGLDDQTRFRRRRNLLELKLIGQLQTRLLTKTQKLAEKRLALLLRNRQLCARPQQRNPAESAMIVESGHKTVVKNQAAGQQERRLGQRHVGVATAEPARDAVVRAVFSRRDSQIKLSRRAIVPLNGGKMFVTI